MDTIWNDEDFISLLLTREAETGEWLGADVLAEPYEDNYCSEWASEAEIAATQQAYDRSVYGI
jgi:hypothetical protein